MTNNPDQTDHFEFQDELIIRVTQIDVTVSKSKSKSKSKKANLDHGGIAPYLKPLIVELISQPSIPKKFQLDLSYVCLGEDLVVAYDVSLSEDIQLIPAQIEFKKRSTNEPDVISELKEAVEEEKRYNDNKDGLAKAGRIKHAVEVKKFEKSGDEITMVVTDKVTVFRHFLGEFAAVLFVPRFASPDKVPDHAVVIGNYANTTFRLSQIVKNNLEHLQRCWNSSGKTTVLVRGEPGSGKEVYARAIHFGSVRRKPDHFLQRSVANLGSSELKIDLYGQITQGGHQIPGRIANASGGSLFLDEFDKVGDGGFYGELLRVLEASEYVPCNGTAPFKVDDVNWILAGAFSGAGTASKLPPDFWSRLTHEIQISNPLSDEDEENRKGYVKSLYMYWLFREAVASASGSYLHLLTATDYKTQACRKIIFGKSEGYNLNLCLAPGDELKQFLDDIGNYTGKYKVKRPNNLDSVAVCYPESFAARDKAESVKEAIGKINPQIKSSSLSDENYIETDHYDSVRAIRQASKVAWSVLLTKQLQNGTSAEPDFVKAFEEAVETINVSRLGNDVATVLRKKPFKEYELIKK